MEISANWDEIRGTFGGEVLGVCIGADREAARGFLEEVDAPFRSAFDGGGWDGPAAKAWLIREIPHAVIVDGDGRILLLPAFLFDLLPPDAGETELDEGGE